MLQPAFNELVHRTSEAAASRRSRCIPGISLHPGISRHPGGREGCVALNASYQLLREGSRFPVPEDYMSLNGSSYSKETTVFQEGYFCILPKRRRKKIEIPLRQIVLGKGKALQPIKRETYHRKPSSTANQTEEMYSIREVQLVASCISALRATFLTATLDPALNRFA